jgi:hypothetical protein
MGGKPSKTCEECKPSKTCEECEPCSAPEQPPPEQPPPGPAPAPGPPSPPPPFEEPELVALELGCCNYNAFPNPSLGSEVVMCQNMAQSTCTDAFYAGTWSSQECGAAAGPVYGGSTSMGVVPDAATSAGPVPVCTCSTSGGINCKLNLQMANLRNGGASLKKPVVVQPSSDAVDLYAQWVKEYKEQPGLLRSTRGGAEMGKVQNILAFANQVEYIKKHNASPSAQQYELVLGPYATVPQAEFIQRNGFKMSEKSLQKKLMMQRDLKGASNQKKAFFKSTPPPPPGVHWAMHGTVNQAVNQGGCGSCYVFSAVAVVEAAYARLTGNLVKFSEQFILNQNSQGCDGGDPSEVLQTYGSTMVLESAVPYDGVPETQPTGLSIISTGVSTATLPLSSCNTVQEIEYMLMSGLAQWGPMAIAVAASSSDWQAYGGGILTPSAGDSTALDHAVVLIGYGTDPVLGPYWRIRNSWGVNWGENGALRVPRGAAWAAASAATGQPLLAGPFGMYGYDSAYAVIG